MQYVRIPNPVAALHPAAAAPCSCYRRAPVERRREWMRWRRLNRGAPRQSCLEAGASRVSCLRPVRSAAAHTGGGGARGNKNFRVSAFGSMVLTSANRNGKAPKVGLGQKIQI